jgi:CBS domain-containing protein
MIFAGIAMIFGFYIPFLGTGLSGIWLAFIGWFLNSALFQSYRQVVIQDVLEDIPVSKVMRFDPPIVSPCCTIDDLVNKHVLGTDDHSFPVMAGQSLWGIVTLEDIRAVPKNQRAVTQVHEIMTPVKNLKIVTPRDEVTGALSQLRQLDVR